MELDQVKSVWKDLPTAVKNEEALRSMMRETGHPLLKGIRRQLVFEILAWIVFLFVYYDFFDGDRRPLIWNVLLVTSILLMLVHNVMGYVASKNVVKGTNIKQSLQHYLVQLSGYAVVSVCSRVLAILCLLMFFLSTITFTTGKYWILAGLLLVIPLQVMMLYNIWLGRIRKIKESIKAFDGESPSTIE